MQPKIRFKEFSNCYRIIFIEDALYYKQPNKYIVSDTEYGNGYKTPVITPGKNFILGYTSDNTNIIDKPTIVFCDFTTKVRYVDFNFKVKSSALKLLYANNGYNLKYLFYILKINELLCEEHKRHYISTTSKLNINIPEVVEQSKVSDFITNIDELIELKNKKLELIKKKKQYYLNNMF